MRPLFITGIGTDTGKTVVAAIVTEALQAAYWKPVQAGLDTGTDSEWVASRISRPAGRILPEAYRLHLAASPHIAAREEGLRIDLGRIAAQLDEWQAAAVALQGPASAHAPAAPSTAASAGSAADSSPGQAAAAPEWLVIEGAGGLLVPLNEQEFMLDLALQLKAPVILVSRNYLGSINHSLLTARACRAQGLPVAGWIFNDQYGDYEKEIVQWSGIPAIASIPHSERLPDPGFIHQQAARIRPALLAALTTAR